MKKGNKFGISSFEYELTDSTNEQAKIYAKSGSWQGEPTIFVANEQTKGRGRYSRKFYSKSGAGAYLSLLFKPNSDIKDTTAVIALSAISMIKSIENLSTSEVKIKWVNDLYFSMNLSWATKVEVEYDGKLYTFELDNSMSDSVTNPTCSESAKKENTISSDKLKVYAYDSKGNKMSSITSYTVTDKNGYVWTIDEDTISVKDANGNAVFGLLQEYHRLFDIYYEHGQLVLRFHLRKRCNLAHGFGLCHLRRRPAAGLLFWIGNRCILLGRNLWTAAAAFLWLVLAKNSRDLGNLSVSFEKNLEICKIFVCIC